MADSSQLFHQLNREEVDTFLKAQGAVERNVLKNEYIFREGDIARGVFILLEGMVEVDKITHAGNRRVVNRFTREGTVFGEVYIFLNERPYDFGCIAVEDSRLLWIPKSVFQGGKEKIAAKLIENMLSILAEKALFLNQKMLVLGAGSIRKKIALHFLQKNPTGREIEMLSREELAQYLGVPRPSLSRELMHMHREGYIHLTGRHVSFDPEELEAVLYR